MVTVYYHPFSRAAGSVWMLEEVGIDYELRFMDFKKGEHKADDVLALNPMGKLPILVDGDLVVTESAAIGLYLADRYALGRLSPAPGDPDRGTYFRWSLFAPSVVEPACAGKAADWKFNAATVGWGEFDHMLDTIEHAIGDGPYLLGERFSMADCIFGGTLRSMLRFKLVEPRPTFLAYIERLAARPALSRADQRNAAEIAKHGLGD